MSRINLEDNRAWRLKVDGGFKFSTGTLVPATGYVLDGTPSTLPINITPLIFMNPAGAVNVRLPTSSDIRRGTALIFVNLSGNVVTFQTDGGAAFTTALTLAANGATRVVCTGNTTQALGWVGW